MNQHNQGFSLLELVVVVAIMSLVLLAVGGLYLSVFRQQSTQIATKDAIEGSAFMVQSVAPNIRLAGLDTRSVFGDDVAVLMFDEQIKHLKHENKPIAGEYLTRSGRTRPALPSPTTLKHSDQLTIVYRAAQDMWNCEGEMVLGPRRVRLTSGQMQDVLGQVVIERYFVAQGESGWALRCDAGKFVPESILRDGTRDRRGQGAGVFVGAVIDQEVGSRRVKSPNTISGLDKGDEIMPNALGLWVRLGVQTDKGVRFVEIDEYRQSFAHLPIFAVKLAVIGQAQGDEQAGELQVFGQSVRALASQEHYRHQVYHMDILFRNIAGGGRGF